MIGCAWGRRVALRGLVLAACFAGSVLSLSAAEPSALIIAAKNQAWQQVSSLLDEGHDVHAKSPAGMTALHWATFWGQESAVGQLLDAGADARAATEYGVTSLELAATHGHAAIAKKLLDQGADANQSCPSGETVLMQAARTGDRATVLTLIQHDADWNATDPRGQTALMWAAAAGHAEVVESLLVAGADRDTTLASGFSALHFAAREGQQDAVERLLKAGADVNTAMTPRNTSGRAPRKGMSPLMLAVESGHFDLALRLVKAGADPNDQRSGYAPLHAISWVRKPNRGDNVDGDPPPRGSGAVPSLAFVRELVACGANVNLQLERGRGGNARLNTRGATPLLLAAATADLPLLNLLGELGGDVTIANVDGCTPLLAAAGVGVFVAGEYAGEAPEVCAAISFLHHRGGQLNTVDDNGETALHGAAYRSFPKVVEHLLELGISPALLAQKNKLGSTPLQVAQGKRPGSFKPDQATIAALQAARANATSDELSD